MKPILRIHSYQISILFLILFLFSCNKTPAPQTIKPQQTSNLLQEVILNKDYLPTALNLINSAKKNITISELYYKNDNATNQITNALLSAKKNGVAISVILEDSIEENQVMARQLNNIGIKTMLDSDETFNHLKTIISDGKTTLLGSTNFSYISFENNNEANILIKDSATANALENFINTNSDPQPFLLIKDDYVNSLIEKLNNAKTIISILMYDFRVYDKYPNSPSNEIAKSIINASKRGIDVKIILEKNNFDEQLNLANQNTANYFAANGVTVKFENPEQISHAKLAIIDDGAFVGSANWNYKSLTINTEANIFTTNRKVVNKFNQYFNSIWENN